MDLSCHFLANKSLFFQLSLLVWFQKFVLGIGPIYQKFFDNFKCTVGYLFQNIFSVLPLGLLKLFNTF